jgi:arylsulfatase A-like enzyme
MRPLLCLIVALTASAADRPNVLWFIVDDMSANFGCYGEQTIATPNVDRLAKEGVRFSLSLIHI